MKFKIKHYNINIDKSDLKFIKTLKLSVKQIRNTKYVVCLDNNTVLQRILLNYPKCRIVFKDKNTLNFKRNNLVLNNNKHKLNRYKSWYLKNKAKINKRTNLWIKNNPSKHAKNVKKHYLKNKIKYEKIRARNRRNRGIKQRKIYPDKIKPYKHAYVAYINSAKARDLSFNLSFKLFYKLVTQSCHYCKISPLKREWRDFTFFANGIDRKNNKLGYNKQNCVPCCKYCNTAKHSFSYIEFKNFLKRFKGHDQ